GRVKHPQIPAITDLALHRDKYLPARLVGVPKDLLAIAFDQSLIQRLEQRFQTLQTIGNGAHGQVEIVGAEVVQQSIGRTVEQILVQKHRDPQGDAQHALGNKTRRWARTSISRMVVSSLPPAPANAWPQVRQQRSSAGRSLVSRSAGKWE